VAGREPSRTALDVEAVRREFPALDQLVHGRPLVYLDSAATALKPRAVLDAVARMLGRDVANVHRGVHLLSQRATAAFEGAREKARALLGAGDVREVVFVRGATEGINLVAQSWGRANLGPGDEILVSGLEHHSNIVPWQMLCAEKGARLVVAPIDDAGDVPLAAVAERLGERTRLVAVAHASNALGTVLPVAEIARLAHERGALVLLDGAQAAPHLPLDVRALGCDFYTFSGHKLYGPTGIGVLWGRRELLEAMPPWQGGGDMIRSVSFERTTYNDLPWRFEAGTPDIAGAVGLGAAIDFVQALGWDAVARHERALLDAATERLGRLPGVRLIGTAAGKIGVVSFVVDGIHPHDLGTVVDREGVAIRTGHHCAQPVMDRFGIAATARATFGVYNRIGDVDALVASVQKAQELFR
jgi:cysteine desulfurase/selenocysteine lyase